MILALAVLGLIWIFAARSISLVLDRVHTVPLSSRPVQELGLAEIASGTLLIDRSSMETDGTDGRPFPMEMQIDSAQHFIVRAHGQTLDLGQLSDSLGNVLHPAANDRARFQIDRGLSWPTPFELNFLTGVTPSWKRHLYYRLIWEKAAGGRLEMVWRYEQYFYGRWASGFMTREGATGLIRVTLRP